MTTTTTYYPDSACVVIALETVEHTEYPPALLDPRRADYLKHVNDVQHRARLEKQLKRIRRTLYRARKPMDPERVEALLSEAAEIIAQLAPEASRDTMEASLLDSGYGSSGIF